MKTTEIIKKYGQPNQTGKGYLVAIDLPYPMRLAWDKKTTVKKMMCHKLVAEKFKAAFSEILEVYGLEKIQELGIDIFGGCFNFRKMLQLFSSRILHSHDEPHRQL